MPNWHLWGALDLASGHHVCIESILTAKPSPKSLEHTQFMKDLRISTRVVKK